MFKRIDENGDVHVQAWLCGKEGHQSMMVYTQEIAIDKMADGRNVSIMVIVRHKDGTNTFQPGVILK
jgi:hypothetical protein